MDFSGHYGLLVEPKNGNEAGSRRDSPFQSCPVYLNHFLYLFRLKKIRAGMGNFAYPVPFNFLFYFFYTN